MRRILALTALLALAAACTTKHTTFTGALKLGKTPEEDYQAGVDELKAKNYAEAAKFFEYVKSKFPFTRFAALSDLRLADAKFDQGRFAEAAEAYKQFATLHPTSDELDYAQYRIGLSYYKDAPGDFALFPPAYEKDQRQTEKAVQALQEFLRSREGKDSEWIAEARKVLDEAKGRLAAREWYVGEYYFSREKWAGAAGRYEALVSRYPGSRHEADALWKMAQAYRELKENFRARTALQQLIAKHPQDPRRADAEKLLAALR
ncbi:outer membrane protein assembly factor BamD [Anaeromyxobacter oryzisoli]|jgi:outer membrane protein assembly factor BamD|uniref:outer membrane protein assembly factor BamD n=1 Tax=Anaeromyxobacter oryzisoli TaxID=2925408 RepID=UPI001F55C4EA|nr:outer membrane protein assembly factor BamD [Anaeromyxobacter sp. SG63]